MVVWLAMVAGAWAACDPADPDLPSNDCDGDGVTIAEGDCDDDDDTSFVGAPELCLDEVDNDCDGLYDEECDVEGLGSLEGGGVCGSGTGSAAWVLLPVLGWRRKRR